MATKSSGFTLIELMVVVAIIGILSVAGVLSYSGYVSGTKQKSTENTMMQISLAETEEYSNGGEYYTQATGGSCSPSNTSSQDIEDTLFESGDIIKENNGYEICVAEAGTSFVIVAEEDKSGADKCTIELSGNGTFARSEHC